MATDYEREILGAEQQRRTAEALRRQAIQPLQGNMVSGWYVAPSWTQYLAQALAGYNAGQKERAANKREEQAGENRNKALSELLSTYPQERDAPVFEDSATTMASRSMGGEDMSGTHRQIDTRHVTPTRADYMSWAAKAAQIDPNIAKMGLGLIPKENKGSGSSNRGQIIFDNNGRAYLADLDTSTGETRLMPYTNPNTGGSFTGGQYDQRLQSLLSGAKKGGSAMMDYNMKQYETAQNAVPLIQKIDSQIKMIEEGDITTGFGADLKYQMNRAQAMLGSKAAQGRVSDTEVLQSMMGSQVFGMIKQLGIGARGLDTPAEREFMLQVMTGTKSLNKETLHKMATIRRNVAERAVQRYNERVDRGELDNFFISTGIPRNKIDVPVYGGNASQTMTNTNLQNQEDREAVMWANANRDDPRAKRILQMHGMQ